MTSAELVHYARILPNTDHHSISSLRYIINYKIKFYSLLISGIFFLYKHNGFCFYRVFWRYMLVLES